jgi:hypothetical protein
MSRARIRKMPVLGGLTVLLIAALAEPAAVTTWSGCCDKDVARYQGGP